MAHKWSQSQSNPNNNLSRRDRSNTSYGGEFSDDNINMIDMGSRNRYGNRQRSDYNNNQNSQNQSGGYLDNDYERGVSRNRFHSHRAQDEQDHPQSSRGRFRQGRGFYDQYSDVENDNDIDTLPSRYSGGYDQDLDEDNVRYSHGISRDEEDESEYERYGEELDFGSGVEQKDWSSPQDLQSRRRGTQNYDFQARSQPRGGMNRRNYRSRY